jgi:nucleoside-diphosphate-sugar epimerase
MNSVLILGASGLLGRAVVDEFRNKGFIIGALGRNSLNLNSTQIKEYCVDILDYEKLASIISQYDFIINCTGQISAPINQCLIQNTDGISNIVDAVKKYNKKLLHFSSVSVYGSSEYVNEESELNPESIYASIKCFSEHIINRNLDSSLILRVSNLYGGNQTKGIVSYLSRQYMAGIHDLDFNNNGEMQRYYLNVSELAKITYLAIYKDLKSGSYNVIGPDFLTIKELVGKFNSILSYSFFAKYSASLPIENIQKINDRKIREELKIDIHSTIDFYIKSIKNDPKK